MSGVQVMSALAHSDFEPHSPSNQFPTAVLATMERASPMSSLCPVCKREFGNEAVLLTKENVMVHAMCFVCHACKCPLKSTSYGCDLNGRFFCPIHMKSAQPPEKVYKTLACGWLRKQGKIVKKWRKRYFVLEVDSSQLRYYNPKDVSQVCGVIDLRTVIAIQSAYLFVPPDKNNPSAPAGSLPALQLRTAQRVWNLACDTDSVREYWLEAIRTAQASCCPASPAASRGVGRDGPNSCSSPSVRSPKVVKASSSSSSSGSASSVAPAQSSSPLGATLPQPTCVSPSQKEAEQPIMQRPASATPEKPESSPKSGASSPGLIPPDLDDVETNSPEDDNSSTSANHVHRARRESGVGRGDGSARASQSIAPNAGSNGEGSLSRKISVNPIIVASEFDSEYSTPTPSTGVSSGAPFMSPGTPGRKVSPAGGITSPIPWQPSTPRGMTSSKSGVAIWESGMGNNVHPARDVVLSECRKRAASAGASLLVQHPKLVIPSSLPKEIAKLQTIQPGTQVATVKLPDDIEPFLCPPRDESLTVDSQQENCGNSETTPGSNVVVVVASNNQPSSVMNS